MKKKFDLIKETVLLIDSDFSILDVFFVTGITEREIPPSCCFYTYKSHMIQEGHCCLCGIQRDFDEKACVSNSGNHAVVGSSCDHVPLFHRATSYDIPLFKIRYQEFSYYVEKDNLFPISSGNTSAGRPVEV